MNAASKMTPRKLERREAAMRRYKLAQRILYELAQEERVADIADRIMQQDKAKDKPNDA